MENSRILLLADDLTGALEVGSKFAAAGVRSLVTTRFDSLPHDLQTIPSAFVVDTETRHLPAAEAARRVYGLAHAARDKKFRFLYKKTDSTLRGNIGAELAAMVEAYSGAPLLYVPAYPRLGRTVSDGFLLLDGISIADTSFAGDPFNPVRVSHIPTLLAEQCRLPVLSRRPRDLEDVAPWSISVCDGETDADLEAAAHTFIGSDAFPLAAGPSGLASHLARLVDLPRSPSPPLPAVKNVLVVNGSLHHLSRSQIANAKQDGFRFLDARSIPSAPVDCGWTILEQEHSTDRATLGFAGDLARSVCRLLQRARFDALVVFGGDTAFAIVEAMGNPFLHPIGEVMEGIPISKIEVKTPAPENGDLFLVTKAGGFGPQNLLTLLWRSIGEG